MSNKEYCRDWHKNNRERSRELSRQYYQRQTAPVQPLESVEKVIEVLKGTESYLLNKVLEKWNKKDWKNFQKIKDGDNLL